MIDIRLNIDLRSAQKALSAFEKQLDKEMKRKLHEAGKLAVEEARKKAPRATGNMMNDLRYEVRQRGTKTILHVGTPHTLYTPYVEYGTKPHMPPVQAIQDWVEIKGIASEPESKKVAWAIAMKIKKKGTKPTHFLKNARRRMVPRIRALMREALIKSLKVLK